MVNPTTVKMLISALLAGTMFLNSMIGLNDISFVKDNGNKVIVTEDFIETNLPEINGNTPERMIINFYNDIGWDGESELDPTKVVINPVDWENIVNEIQEKAETQDELIAIGFLWLNKGAGAENEVPKGRVRIYENSIDTMNMDKYDLNEDIINSEKAKEKLNDLYNKELTKNEKENYSYVPEDLENIDYLSKVDILQRHFDYSIEEILEEMGISYDYQEELMRVYYDNFVGNESKIKEYDDFEKTMIIKNVEKHYWEFYSIVVKEILL
ncbi:MAG: hypothetical protein ACOCUI_03125 [bacterium]